MKKFTLQANLLGILNGRYPVKAQLVKKLVEILNMEREGVYRRLRGEAVFTFAEVAIIAEEMGISLDNLIGIDLEKARPFSLVLIDYETPSSEDYEMCESYMRLLKVLKGDQTTRCIETWNTLPHPLISKYPHLVRFHVFKWTYQYKNYTPGKKYENIILPERYIELMRENLEHMKDIPYTEYIFDKRLFTDFVNDICYFYGLGLISKESLVQIRKELNSCIDYLEQRAISGKFEDTGKELQMYVAEIHIEQNECYIESDIYTFSMFRVLTINAVSSVDGTRNERIKNWLLGHKRLSTHISVSGEVERIKFFSAQRNAVQKLNGLLEEE